MAHWAEIDSDNKVVRVTVGSNDEPDQGYQWLIDNLGGNWIKTSFNTKGGIHYGEDNLPDNGIPLHYNFARPGMLWDGTGFCNPQPFPSWTLNKETYLWESPVPYPTDGDVYAWNEDTQSWDVIG